MKIAIVGGKLQGTEIAFLAKIANIDTVLIEKTSGTPASGLCDEEYNFDVVSEKDRLLSILKDVDMVIPALENRAVIDTIYEVCSENNIINVFDMNTYNITSSKLRSDKVLHNGDFPHPLYYPEAKAPYVIKPSDGSGSESVEKVESESELKNIIAKKNGAEGWVVQEFLEGDLYSVEVTGTPGNYEAHQLTQIHLDENYDCNYVSCPVGISHELQETFKETSVRLAELIKLKGLMDVEAINHNGELKILEMDARFPSQTPVSVFFSTGVNLLIKMIKCFTDYNIDEIISSESVALTDKPNYVMYRHIQYDLGKVTFKGEHVFGDAGPLHIENGFLGSDYAMTDYSENEKKWQAVLIFIGENQDAVNEKWYNTKGDLVKEFTD